MDICPYFKEVIQYLIVGTAYASIKHYALWEYYRERSFWTKLHHYWFEACFWPADFVYNTMLIMMRKGGD